jgi:integrase
MAGVTMGTGPDGRAVRRHHRGRTRAEVTEKVRALEAERDRSGGRATPTSGTVGSWLAEWLTSIERTRKPKTYTGYESLIRCHTAPISGVILTKLTIRDIDNLLAGVDAPSVPGALHRCLRSAFNTAVKRGLLHTNPRTHATVPRYEEPEIEPLSIEEVRAVPTAAGETRMPTRWSVALALGLRQGESLGLRRRDLNLDESVMKVTNQLRGTAPRPQADALPSAPRGWLAPGSHQVEGREAAASDA